MADGKDREPHRPKKSCRYCEKNVNSGVVCAKCDSSFHSSCAQRVKTCCEENIWEKSQTENRLAAENELLKQIIQDKTQIINLLEEKIVILEEKINDDSVDKQKQGNKNVDFLIFIISK